MVVRVVTLVQHALLLVRFSDLSRQDFTVGDFQFRKEAPLERSQGFTHGGFLDCVFVGAKFFVLL